MYLSVPVSRLAVRRRLAPRSPASTVSHCTKSGACERSHSTSIERISRNEADNNPADPSRRAELMVMLGYVMHLRPTGSRAFSAHSLPVRENSLSCTYYDGTWPKISSPPTRSAGDYFVHGGPFLSDGLLSTVSDPLTPRKYIFGSRRHIYPTDPICTPFVVVIGARPTLVPHLLAQSCVVLLLPTVRRRQKSGCPRLSRDFPLNLPSR